MNREELLLYEPFRFYVQSGTEVHDLNAPTSLSCRTEENGPVTVFADGHAEFLQRNLRKTVTMEGVLPFFRDDPRLSDPGKHELPRQLARTLEGFLKRQERVRVFCNYLNLYDDCVIRAFSWEPVADSEGDLRYQLTFTVGNEQMKLPKTNAVTAV